MNRFMIAPATITTVRRLYNHGRFHTAWPHSGLWGKTANGQELSFVQIAKRDVHNTCTRLRLSDSIDKRLHFLASYNKDVK